MTEKLNRIIGELVNISITQMQSENRSTTYILCKQPESNDIVLISHTQEPSSSKSQDERVNFTQDWNGEVAHGLPVYESNNNIEQNPVDAVRKDITSLNIFLEIVATTLYELEKP